MTAYVALHELPLDKIVRAASLPPDLRRVAARPAGRAADQRSRPALRADPAQRQRRRPRPGARGGRLRAALRAPDEPARGGARPRRHPLRQPGRPRPARQLLQRPRPRHADPAPAAHPRLRQDRRLARRRPAQRPPAAADRERSTSCCAMAPWVNGVKTGHTFGAGYVLVGSGRRKGVELISAVIGAPTDEDRFADNLRLLDYGFSPLPRGRRRSAPARSSPIRRSATRAGAAAARGATRDGRRPPRPAVDGRGRAPDEVEGPIRRGAALGRRPICVGGLRRATVPLRAGQRRRGERHRPGPQLRRRTADPAAGAGA